jgi:TRAP-type mannitol/chloroaromatic compound transport system substrate-binding protein
VGVRAAFLMLAVAMVAGGLAAREAVSQPKPVTLKIQASWPAASLFWDNLKLFAERVEKMSGGRLKVEAFPAGAIVPAFEVVDATHRGVLDGAHTWSGYLIGKHMAAVLFTGGPGGPFGMDVFDHLGWFYEGGGWELYNEWYEKVLKLNVTGFPILPFAPQMFGWFKRPFKGWEEVKGRKMRAVGMNAQILKEAGASVVSLPGGEIVPAAERGVIDAAEWCCPAEDVRLGFADVWKFYYMPSLHESTETGDLVLNRGVWEKLPADLQEIVKVAATEVYLRWWLRFTHANAVELRELQDKRRVTVSRTPDEVLRKQLETWDKIREREAARDPFFKKVVESQRKYAEVVVPARRFMFPPYEFAADYYWKKPQQ